jgi:hypothetical protein
MNRARTYHCTRMRRCIEQSNGLVPSLLCPSWVDYIIATRGYDFRKGHLENSVSCSMGQPEQHHRQSSMLLVDRYIVTEPPRPCFRVRFGSSGSAGPLLTVLLLSLLKISSNGEILHGANFVPRLPATPHALTPPAGILPISFSTSLAALKASRPAGIPQ